MKRELKRPTRALSPITLPLVTDHIPMKRELKQRPTRRARWRFTVTDHIPMKRELKLALYAANLENKVGHRPHPDEEGTET